MPHQVSLAVTGKAPALFLGLGTSEKVSTFAPVSARKRPMLTRSNWANDGWLLFPRYGRNVISGVRMKIEGHAQTNWVASFCSRTVSPVGQQERTALPVSKHSAFAASRENDG